MKTKAHAKIGLVKNMAMKRKIDRFLHLHVYNIPLLKNILHMLNNRRGDYLKKYSHLASPDDKKQMLKYLFKYGITYEEYFFYDCKNQDVSTFISDAKRWQYYHRLNGKRAFDIFIDKIATYELFDDLYGRECAKISDKASFYDFVERHSKFVYKRIDGSLGKGVRLIDASENKEAVWNELCSKVPFIVEEPIKQGEAMAALHPNSVNTLRIATVLTGSTADTYKVNFFAPFAKVGQKGSFVDNGGAGGILIAISPDGTVSTDGIDEKCHIYKEHPDTKITFKGYPIPEFEQALKLAETAALRIKADARIVGWDLAYTDKGWVIVEGNAFGQLIGQQMCDKVGKKKEFDALMAKI